jgi:ABC-2 type transport system permease protein
VLVTSILSELETETNYFSDKSTNNVDNTVVYFYSLIGMLCMYAGFWGVKTVNETEANISEKGARLNISPAHKLKVLMCSLLVALIIQYIECLLVLAYLVFILGVDFGSQIGYVMLLMLFRMLCWTKHGLIYSSM